MTDLSKKTDTATCRVNAINAVLPQTQCGECGYSGCLPYAQALAYKETTIDRCPPGGVRALRALAALLQVDPQPYLATVEQKWRSPAVAVIRENECIGCTKCIQACPVDAIIGSGKLMHTVLSDECTGCGLCVAPCPVDCIEMVNIPVPLYDKALAQQRYHTRQARLLGEKRAQQLAYHEKRTLNAKAPHNTEDKAAKNNYILAALARVQAKKT